MRIISKFKDYYDCIKACDQESFPVYVRDTRCTKFSSGEEAEPLLVQRHLSVFFCGKTYKGFFCYTDASKKTPYFILQDEFDSTPQEFLAKAPFFDSVLFKHRNLVQFLCSTSYKAPVINKNMLPEGVAIACGQDDLLITNPRLSEIGFQRILDPYTAYQELSMWTDNLAVHEGNREPKGMTDKLKAESKGFDKWSFRKHKDENLPKRRRSKVF
jgi:hypothetical protein